MPRPQPPQFTSIQCRHCGAIVALAPAGTFLHTTHLKCAHCGETRTILKSDSSEQRLFQSMTVAGA